MSTVPEETTAGPAPVRVALVGCGAIGELVARHVYTKAAPDEFQLVAAIDPQAERRDAVAAALGVPAYPSTQAAVEAGVAIDAADIRTPHGLHADTAVDALGRGWHVLVEKPLATTLADGKRIRAAAIAAGRVAAVAENYPHIAAVRAAREAMAAGAVGDVLTLRSTRAFTLDGVWLRDGWRRGGGESAGLLLDQGTHHTSLLRFLGGPITQVSAQASGPSHSPVPPTSPVPSTSPVPPTSPAPATSPVLTAFPVPSTSAIPPTSSVPPSSPVPPTSLAPLASQVTRATSDRVDTFLLTVRFASGLAAQSLYSWTAFPLAAEAEGTVIGSRGRIEIRVDYDGDGGGATLWDEQSPYGRAISPPENYYDSHTAIVRDWVAAIRTGGTPRVTLDDGLADLAVVLAAGRSLPAGGQPVDVAEES